MSVLPAARRKTGSLLAVSDLHVGSRANRAVVDAHAVPSSPDDWLLVAGDVGDTFADVEWVLSLLTSRFARVVWAPGNHELWRTRRDPAEPRGEARYRELVAVCRRLSVDSPEDVYPRWPDDHGALVVVPLFLLYDYTFGTAGGRRAEALRAGRAAGVVCADELLLSAEPYDDVAQWCRARVRATERRLDGLTGQGRTVLVNHFPLVEQPTLDLRNPKFSAWCGTTATADWPQRYNAAVVVYGHLHIPRTTWHAGIRHEEVSLGYPQEWARRAGDSPLLRQVWPPRDPDAASGG